ncbi:hypothetical protein Lesp01_03440 [Lentzea sp. NBRC 102530]|nr:hypothetical protein Lesp01_03440 [Lentzea sp. NBRC 102530]
MNDSFGQPWNVIGALPWLVAVSSPSPGLPCIVNSAFTAGFCFSPTPLAGVLAEVGVSVAGLGWAAGDDPQAVVAAAVRTAATIVRRMRGPLIGGAC